MSVVVDFHTRREVELLNNVIIKIPKTREEYLEVCKATLTEDDYVDVLCGILDNEIYDNLCVPVQNIIRSYYAFKE
jgi:hypothetical protein